MIDTYMKSTNKSELDELKGFVTNMIGPLPHTDDQGICIWFACVRAPFPIMPYGNIELCSFDEGKAACGVWAEID